SVIRQVVALRRLLTRARPLSCVDVGASAREIGVKLGLSSLPQILESDDVTSPMVVNPFRPAVLLPPGFAESLTPNEARMALAHEIAHIRRRDLWLAWVPALVQVLFFFLPPAWLACREWSTAREAACDDEALEATGAATADYSRLLLKIVAADSQQTF